MKTKGFSFKRSWLALCIIFIGLSTSGNAQFQLNVGYDFTYSSNEGLNNVLDTYNANLTNELGNIDPIHISNGVLFGVRYNIDFIGLEANWIYRFSEKEAIISDDGTTANSMKLLGRFQTFSVGLDNEFDWLSYGASLDYNLYSIKSRYNNNSAKVSLLNDSDVYLTPYLGFNLGGTRAISLSLRPFLRIPITSVDYKDFDTKLNGSNTTEETKKNPFMFGLRVIFTNGSK